MARSPARESLRPLHHALLAIHLLLAAAALHSNFLFLTRASPDFLASAQELEPADTCTAGGSLDARSCAATPEVAKDVRRDVIFQATSSPDDSFSVLIFQTSISITVPCVTTRIRPPQLHEPPVRTIIASPTQSGTYPVILFKHGFNLANCFYTQLFQYLASSGYIIVAPQAVTLSPDCMEEINETAKVANWIQKSLAVVLNAAVSDANVFPDVSKLVMAGHSRGGKIAFAMALGMPLAELPSFSALVVLDPVDGTDSGVIVKPPIVEVGCNHTHNKMSFPVLILGTGYGSQKGILGAPPCAPTCCNHAAYFNCSSSPIIYHFLASEYGHLDFLDDSQFWTAAICVSGKSKAQLRDFTGHLIIAFLRSTLEGNQEDMDHIVENWESASIKLEEPQIYMEEEELLKTEHVVIIAQEAVL